VAAAVYGLLALDKPMTPIYEGQYDLRLVKASMLKMLGDDGLKALLGTDPRRIPAMLRSAVTMLREIPAIDETAVSY